MTRAMQYIKYNLFINFKIWQSMLLMFVITPMIFSYFLAFTNRKVYDVKPEPPEFAVHIKNEDHSQTGKALNQIFDQLAKEKIIVKEKNAAKAEFTLTIPEHFGQSLSEGKPAEWLVTLGKKTSKETGEVFQMLLQPISNQLQELPQLEGLVEDPEVAQTILASVNQSMQGLSIKEEQVASRLSPTSNQHYALMAISFIMMMLFTATLVGSTKPELQGTQKRLKLLPLTPAERIILNWISNTLTYSFWIGLYALGWKTIDPSTFAGHPLSYVFIILLQVGFLLGLTELIALVTPARAVGLISGLMSMVWILFSGVIPFDKIGGSLSLKILQENWVERIFNWPYQLIAQGDGLRAYLSIGSVIGMIALLSLVAAITILKQREVS